MHTYLYCFPLSLSLSFDKEHFTALRMCVQTDCRAKEQCSRTNHEIL